MSLGARRGTARCWPEGLAGVVRQEVQAHVPGDEREHLAQRRIAEALQGLARPFDEEAGPVHLTASAVIVGSRGTVLHLHKRLRVWLQPGGHIDPGETPGCAAQREAAEETGLVLGLPAGGEHLIHVDVHGAAKGHTHLDLRYVLLGPDDDPAPPAGESQDVRWFAWDEADELADASLAPALRAARAFAPGTTPAVRAARVRPASTA